MFTDSDPQLTRLQGPRVTGVDGGSGNLATSAYTTTYTVTSCHLFDMDCKTGVVTTQTFGAVGTVTVTAGAKSDDDNAAVQPMALGWIFVVIGAFAVGFNLV